ncbi:hypothetical protein E4U46_002118 [Claviceps purpurea]|nr:hypothetical protein E4U46_002118 [Claviceps purpurea]
MLVNGTSSRCHVGGLALASRRAARTSPLLAPSAVLLRSRQGHCRAISFAAWARGRERGGNGHVRPHARPGLYEHRCIDSSNRKLHRHSKPSHHRARAIVKTVCAHVANGPTITPAAGFKYVDIKDIKSWSDEFSGGLPPHRNFEHIEHEAIDRLLGVRKHHNSQSVHWDPLSRIRKYLKSNQSERVTGEDILRAKEPTTVEDAGISRPNASSQRASKASQVKKDSLQKSDAPNVSRQATSEHASENYTDLHKYKAVENDEPDGLTELTSEEQTKKYQDLDKYASPHTSNDVAAAASSAPSYHDLQKYKPVEWNEPDGLREQTPEELSKNYDDLSKYGPATWNEPDGLPALTPEESSKNYDDLDRYGSVKWNEPDGLPALTPEELSKNYDDLDKYGPVKWNEPNGLPGLTPEELSKQYDDLNTYKKPFGVQDAFLEAHEAAQQDATPRAEPIAAKVDRVEENAPADPAKSYDDLDKYGPAKYNEPDGLPNPTPEELSKDYQDLHLYSQYPNTGPDTPRIHPEEASKQYEDLRLYDDFPNTGPLEERIHPELASKQYDDLDKYPSSGYEEADKTSHVHPEELTKNYQDLDEYRVSSLDAFDKKYPTHPEEASKAYDDLGAYEPVMHNETVASSLGPFEKMAGLEENTELQTAADIRSDVLRRACRNSKRTLAQRAKGQPEQSTLPESSTDSASNRPVFGGNCDKSLPEEVTAGRDTFARSKAPSFQRTPAADAKPFTSPGALGHLAEEEVIFAALNESFPSERANETTKGQPALNRDSGTPGRTPLFSALDQLEKTRLKEDPYSKDPQGLELSYTDEHAAPTTSPAFTRHYQNRSEAETLEVQPVSYKVLAYDPSTQSISIAETSSGVSDTSTPASPADILPHVSNPAKFFPYFSKLQAEGYEIVSGGGDVLVFRKVRPGTAASESVHHESVQQQWVCAGQGSEVKVGKKKRSFGRKVVLGTAWVAGGAYVVSVAAEMFSTGGRGL